MQRRHEDRRKRNSRHCMLTWRACIFYIAVAGFRTSRENAFGKLPRGFQFRAGLAYCRNLVTSTRQPRNRMLARSGLKQPKGREFTPLANSARFFPSSNGRVAGCVPSTVSFGGEFLQFREKLHRKGIYVATHAINYYAARKRWNYVL